MTSQKNKSDNGQSEQVKNKLKKRKPVSKTEEKYFLSSSKEKELIHDLKIKQIQIEVQKQELIQQRNLLEASNDKYADLYDFSPVGYLTIDDHGLIVDANLTSTEIMGVEKKYLVKIPFINFLILKDTKRFFSFLREGKKNNSRQVDEFSINNRRDGTSVIQIAALPVFDYNSKKLNFRLSLLDINEKRIAQKELEETEGRFRLMADASPAMIWMSNKNNILIYLNKKSMDFYGRTLENLKGNMWFNQIHPEDKGKFDEAFMDASKEKVPFDLEIRRKNRNGEYRWILDSVSPRFVDDEEFEGYVGIGIDITERKQIKMNIENSLKEKEILLKEVHHRVKNNLQIISSILSLQTHYINNKSIPDILSACKNRVLSMSLLHEQLYNSNSFVNINFESYIKILTDQLLRTYRDPSISIKFNLDIENIQLDIGTSINLGLILNELITNSLQYAFRENEKGEIKISLKHSEPEKAVILKVSDNGKGLPEDFDIHNLKSLGLEIVSSLVDQLKGELEIHSNGKTEFQIII